MIDSRQALHHLGEALPEPRPRRVVRSHERRPDYGPAFVRPARRPPSSARPPSTATPSEPRWARRVAVNRKARHDYPIEDTFEAGIVLTGTEIKSIRAGKVNLQDAYARIERGEAWLVGAHIAPVAGRQPLQPRAAARPQAAPPSASRSTSSLGRATAKGLTLVPLRAVHRRPRPRQGRARPRPRQAAPRPAPRHRRARRPARHGARAGGRAPRSLGRGRDARLDWPDRRSALDRTVRARVRALGMRGLDRAGSPENASRGAVRPR